MLNPRKGARQRKDGDFVISVYHSISRIRRGRLYGKTKREKRGPFRLESASWAYFERESGEEEEVSYTEDARDGNGAMYWGLCRFVGVAKDQ